MGELGSAIRMLRRDSGQTQEAVAHAACISYSHLRHVEYGGSLPSIEMVDTIATALNLSRTDRQQLIILWLKERGIEW